MEGEPRIIEIMVAGAGWTRAKLCDVTDGDQIRMFESDGTPVRGDNGETEFIATKDAYQLDNGVWCIETED